jgi:hypothetical protein
LEEKKEVNEAKASEKKVFGQGPMNFSRPPKFNSKKAGKFAQGEFDSLDALETPDTSKPKQSENPNQGKDFVNLGAQPKSGQKEEETKGSEPQKPRFKGRMNLAGTGS